MKSLLLFIEITLINISTPFWWGCCGTCTGCGGWAYQPTFSYLNFPIYQRIPNQQIENEPQNPLVILHRKTVIKEVPYEEESDEERPSYIMRARKIRPRYEEDYEPERYMPQRPVEKIVYLQQPSPNYNVYTTPPPPPSMYMPQGGNINIGQTDTSFMGQQNQQMPQQTPYQQMGPQNPYQQMPPQTPYQQAPPQQQSYQNPPPPPPPQQMVQGGNQQQYKRKS